MPWNYRVIKRYYQSHQETVYTIHEVYYKDGKIVAISEEADTPMGDSLEELRGELRRMFIDALAKPVLEWNKIPFDTWDDEECGYDTDDELDKQGHLWLNSTGYDSH